MPSLLADTSPDIALDPLAESRPFFIEEPFHPEDLENTARLAALMPVASGEIAAGKHAFHELMHRGGVTVLQPDVGVCGGITEWRRIAARRTRKCTDARRCGVGVQARGPAATGGSATAAAAGADVRRPRRGRQDE